jgi:hypothetical protein
VVFKRKDGVMAVPSIRSTNFVEETDPERLGCLDPRRLQAHIELTTGSGVLSDICHVQ